MDWKILAATKDKHEIEKLIKAGIIGEALQNSQNNQAQIFLKQVLNPMIFDNPNCVEGIENIFDLNSPQSIRLYVGYLYLEVRVVRSAESNSSTKLRDICNLIHSNFTFSGDTNHHLAYLYIKFNDHQPKVHTESLLMQRLLNSFEIGSFDSFQVILRWLLTKVRNVSRIRDFTTKLIIQMAILSPDLIKDSPDAMDLLINNYGFALKSATASVQLTVKLISTDPKCPISCLFALLDKCILDRNLWVCFPSLTSAFKKVSIGLDELPSQFEVNYPYLLLACAQKIILEKGINVKDEERFVVYVALTFDLLKCSHLLLNVPAMRETMETITVNLCHGEDVNFVCGWIFNRMNPTELAEVKSIDNKLMPSAASLKTILVNFDRLYFSLSTFSLKENLILKYWEICKSTLSILAIFPLVNHAKEIVELIIKAVYYCISILLKSTHTNRVGFYFKRQREFLLPVVSKLDKKYNVKHLMELFKDPMVDIVPYSCLHLYDFIK